MAWQLWRGARGLGAAASFDERLRARVPRILGAAAVMGMVLAGGAWALSGLLHDAAWRYGALALLCGVGIVAYFGAAFALGAVRPSDLRGALRR
jgi:putative peptidoglycan lipid II flippase